MLVRGSAGGREWTFSHVAAAVLAVLASAAGLFAAAQTDTAGDGTTQPATISTTIPGVEAQPRWAVDLGATARAEVLGFAKVPVDRNDFLAPRLTNPLLAVSVSRASPFGTAGYVAVVMDDSAASSTAHGELVGVSLETGDVVWRRTFANGTTRCTVDRPSLVDCVSTPDAGSRITSSEVFVVDGVTGATVEAYVFDQHVQDFIVINQSVFALLSHNVKPAEGEPVSVVRAGRGGVTSWLTEITWERNDGWQFELDYDPVTRSLFVVKDPWARAVDLSDGAVDSGYVAGRTTLTLAAGPEVVVAYRTAEKDMDPQWRVASTTSTVGPTSTAEPWRPTTPAGVDDATAWAGLGDERVDVTTGEIARVWLPREFSQYDWVYTTSVAGLLVVDEYPRPWVVDTVGESARRLKSPEHRATPVIGSEWVAWIGDRFWVTDLAGRVVYRSDVLDEGGSAVPAPGGVLFQAGEELIFVAVDRAATAPAADEVSDAHPAAVVRDCWLGIFDFPEITAKEVSCKRAKDLIRKAKRKDWPRKTQRINGFRCAQRPDGQVIRCKKGRKRVLYFVDE